MLEQSHVFNIQKVQKWTLKTRPSLIPATVFPFVEATSAVSFECYPFRDMLGRYK